METERHQEIRTEAQRDYLATLDLKAFIKLEGIKEEASYYEDGDFS